MKYYDLKSKESDDVVKFLVDYLNKTRFGDVEIYYNFLFVIATELPVLRCFPKHGPTACYRTERDVKHIIREVYSKLSAKKQIRIYNAIMIIESKVTDSYEIPFSAGKLKSSPSS